MGYQVLFSEEASKEIKKLDKPTKVLLEKWLRKHLVGCENPRAFGKGLTADKASLWRYRIGDYRLICDIRDKELIILAVTFGHRREINMNKR